MKLKDKLKEIRKKGFTLIELIVVIAVLGILVLMAAPKFLGYTAEAKMKQIQSDIKAHEVQASVELIDNPNAESTWTALTSDELAEINASNKVLNKKGKSVTTPIGEDSYVLDLDEVKSKLKGKFIWTENDEVVYYDENLSKLPEDDKGDGSGDEEGKLPEVDKGDGSGDEGSEQLPEFTPESHFEWVKQELGGYYTDKHPTEKGYYKYIGTGEEVVHIPHVIEGTKMTSYYNMFYNASADVKKVVSTNTEVTDMSWMFYNSQGKSLDLSNFDTSKVTKMASMFYSSKAESLDLSNFNTSNVTNMSKMFNYSKAKSLNLSKFDTGNVTRMDEMFVDSQATSLDLSNFNTSKVTNMSYMFQNYKATSLDLSNFDTSKVTNMYAMFSGSQATSLDLRSFDTAKVTNMNKMFADSQATTGYARTQADADKLNASSDKPIGLTFTVKQP